MTPALWCQIQVCPLSRKTCRIGWPLCSGQSHRMDETGSPIGRESGSVGSPHTNVMSGTSPSSLTTPAMGSSNGLCTRSPKNSYITRRDASSVVDLALLGVVIATGHVQVRVLLIRGHRVAQIA